MSRYTHTLFRRFWFLLLLLGLPGVGHAQFIFTTNTTTTTTIHLHFKSTTSYIILPNNIGFIIIIIT